MMPDTNWMLDGHTPVPAPSLMEWARWYETADRRVARTRIGEAEVSTVFLGLNHNFEHSGRPVLFETMVFGGPWDEHQWRYSTWEEAEEGHAGIVAMLERGEVPA